MATFPVLLAALFGVLLASAEPAEAPTEEWIASASTPQVAEQPDDIEQDPSATSESPATDGEVEPIRRPSEHPMSTPKDWRKRLRMKDPTRSGRSAYA